jgi:hypothetical protein
MRKNYFKQVVLALIGCWVGCSGGIGKAQTIPLLTPTTPWRYNKTGTELGTAWQARLYNDTVTGWEGPGTMLFGFESTEQEYNNIGVFFNTRFPDPQTAGNFRTNFYFRAHFTMPFYSPATLAAVTLQTTNWIDDGAVFYLNGVELGRFNMPTGPVNASTFAGPALAEPIRFITNYVAGANLQAGDNVLAVELHQANTGSSDEVFGMVMNAILPSPPLITVQPVGQTNVVGATNAILSVTATGGGTLSYQWYSNTVRIANATNSTYTVATVRTNTADYYVIVSNVVSTLPSDTAHVAIVLDTFSPLLVYAQSGPPPSNLASNQVLVTFNKRLELASATAITNYSIGILGTTNTVAVTGAQHAVAGSSNVSQVKLTAASNLTATTNYVLTVNRVAATNRVPILPNSQIGISFIQSNVPPLITHIFPMSMTWTYTEPDHDIGTNWIGTNYNGDLDFACPDGCWGFGSAMFYSEANAPLCLDWSYNTRLDVGPIVYYFRARFVAPTNSTGPGLLYMTNFIDDGVIFYLNGKEIFRTNMPDGPVDYITPSTTQFLPGTCNPPNLFVIPVSNLIMPPPATNVLAAELHESGSGTDFDQYFGTTLDWSAPLVITNASAMPPKLTITRQGLSATNVISWTNSGNLTWGLEYATSLKSNTTWTTLPNASPYTNTAPGVRIFRTHKQ